MKNYEFIRKCNSAKYEHGGRDLNKSIDCWGLVTEYYRERLGVDIPKHEELIYKDNEEEISSKIRKVFSSEFKELGGPKKHAIVILKFNGKPIHIGVMINEKEILNLYQNKQVLIENIQKYIDNNQVYGYFTYGDTV